jgi:hypothetical protein
VTCLFQCKSGIEQFPAQLWKTCFGSREAESSSRSRNTLRMTGAHRLCVHTGPIPDTLKCANRSSGLMMQPKPPGYGLHERRYWESSFPELHRNTSSKAEYQAIQTVFWTMPGSPRLFLLQSYVGNDMIPCFQPYTFPAQRRVAFERNFVSGSTRGETQIRHC